MEWCWSALLLPQVSSGSDESTRPAAMSAGSSVPMREMACPSETYSDAFLSRRSGNPNTRYRAIKSETWRWHFRGVVYIFRKPRLFARGTAYPAISDCCGTQHRTGALGQGENSVVGGGPTSGNFGQRWVTRKAAADKKAGGNDPPAHNPFSFRSLRLRLLHRLLRRTLGGRRLFGLTFTPANQRQGIGGVERELAH